MKLIHHLYLPFVIAFALSSCVPSDSTMIPTRDETQLSSPTFTQLTSKPINTPAEAATMTPPATLEPEKAQETMKVLLQQPVDCMAPCLWGITPEETSLDEAKNIFTHLGLQIKSTTFQDKDFYGVAYDFENGLSISENLEVQDNIVRSLTLNIDPEKQQAGVLREWLAYSPETLIKRYGIPSEAQFFVGRGPNPSYSMFMYFDAVDLIIQYDSYELYSNMQVCPLSDQIDYVRMWLGKDPMYPPLIDPTIIPLEDAASITLEDFSNLMTGDTKKACFNLKGERLP